MYKKFRGFTLIELLVVIAILAILVVLSILALNAARARARDTERKSNLRTLQTGLAIYDDEFNSYPDKDYYSSIPGNCLKDVLNTMQISDSNWPEDPLANNLGYGYAGTANDYCLAAKLENDPGSETSLGYNHKIGPDCTSNTPSH